MVFIEDAVVADNLKILHLRLSNEHSVERIAMFSWDRARPDGVIERNRQSVASKLGQVMIQLANEFLAGW